jgi:hypothetical protein
MEPLGQEWEKQSNQPPESCEMCGRLPAKHFLVRRHVGLVVRMKWYKVEADLCRDHALSVSRSFLLRTLVQGWWGYLSIFINSYVVGLDLFQVARAIFMRKPGRSDPFAAQRASTSTN